MNVASLRARAQVRATFAAVGARTKLVDLYETGGWRLRLTHADCCEAALINSGGGMAEGDRARCDFTLGESARVTISTQAPERAYRSAMIDEAEPTRVSVRLTAGPDSWLRWLPQETILFDRFRLKRTLEADLHPFSQATLLECFVFGRHASGETRVCGDLSETWRIRRGGALIFAESFVLRGSASATLEHPACGGGARVCATLLHVAPDAERYLDRVRGAIERREGCFCGVSAWNGMLVARLLSQDSECLRSGVALALGCLPGGGPPRLWS